MRTFLILLSLLVCALILQPVNGQFGFNKKDKKSENEATVNANGEVQLSKEVMDIVTSLVSTDPSIKEQDAVDIATLLDAAKKDPETKIMLSKMKKEQAEAFAGTANMKPLEIIKGLEQAYDELKMVEYLFQDKERALREMHREGLIPPEKLQLYQKDPTLLEKDTRKGLYFMFVALAEAAGYL